MTPPIQTLCCPGCHRPQVVPTPAARGPRLRLGCPACSTALYGDPEATHVGRGALEVPAAPVDAQWYAVVEGEVVGPLTRAEVERYHRAEVIDDEAPLWHDGFRGWAPLSATATFAPLCGGRRRAPRARRPTIVDLTEVAQRIESRPPPLPVPVVPAATWSDSISGRTVLAPMSLPPALAGRAAAEASPTRWLLPLLVLAVALMGLATVAASSVLLGLR